MMGKFFSKRSKNTSTSKPATTSTKCIVGDEGDEKVSISQQVGFNNVQLQHNDAVVSVACCQPGLCLSGSKDMTVVLYDYRHKQQLDIWKGHSGPVTKVFFGSVVNAVFSASRDKTIKLWETGCSNFRQEFVGHTLVVTAIHLNQDNRLLCSGSRDNTVKLWDVESCSCIKTNTIAQNLVTDLKFTPGGTLIVQTGEDKEIRIFDVRTLQPVISLPKKQYIQMCCDVSSDGNYIVSSSNGFSGNGCEATIWDIRARKMVREFFGHHEAVEACLFYPGVCSGYFLTASRDCSVKLWNINTGVQESDCVFSGSGPLTSLAAYQDGSILAGSFNQGIFLLSLKDKKLIKEMNF